MSSLSHKLYVVATSATALALPLVSKAASEGLKGAADDIGDIQLSSSLSSESLPTLVGTIISLLLGTLGIIFVGMVVYAGFLYLTDAGSGDGVKKAKKMLTQAIIGMVIIIAAYAISSYVIEALTTIAA